MLLVLANEGWEQVILKIVGKILLPIDEEVLLHLFCPLALVVPVATVEDCVGSCIHGNHVVGRSINGGLGELLNPV